MRLNEYKEHSYSDINTLLAPFNSFFECKVEDTHNSSDILKFYFIKNFYSVLCDS